MMLIKSSFWDRRPIYTDQVRVVKFDRTAKIPSFRSFACLMMILELFLVFLTIS